MSSFTIPASSKFTPINPPQVSNAPGSKFTPINPPEIASRKTSVKRSADELSDRLAESVNLASLNSSQDGTIQSKSTGQPAKKIKEEASSSATMAMVSPKASGATPRLGKAAETAAEKAAQFDELAEKFKLLPHQKEVLAKILKKDSEKEGIILAHQAGLGKTRTSLSFIYYLAASKKLTSDDHALILAPNNDILNHWQAEIAKMEKSSGDKSLMTFSYTGKDRDQKLEQAIKANRKAGKIILILTTYPTLIKSQTLLETVTEPQASTDRQLQPGSIKAVIADEGDILRNKGTVTYEKLSPLLQSAAHRMIVTASPLQNNFSDLINQVKLLAQSPDQFTELENSLKQLFKAIKESYVNVKESGNKVLTRNDLRNLLEPFDSAYFGDQESSILPTLSKLSQVTGRYVEHLTAEDVSNRKDFATKYDGIKLPSEPVEVTVDYLPFDLQQQVSSERFQDMKSRRTLDSDASALSLFNVKPNRSSGAAEKGNTYMEVITDLKLLADIPGQAPLLDAYLDENSAAGLDMRSPKIEALCNQLSKSFESEKTAIVAVDFTEKVSPIIKQAIEDRFKDSVEVKSFSGKVSATDKTKVINWFKAPVKPGEPKKLLLLASKAGERGLDLQNNNHFYLFNGDFNPEKERQKIGRSNRIGQESGVTVFRFQGLPIEEMIKDIKKQKEALIKNTWKMDPNKFLKEMLNYIISENGKQVQESDKEAFAEMLKKVLLPVREREQSVSRQVPKQIQVPRQVQAPIPVPRQVQSVTAPISRQRMPALQQFTPSAIPAATQSLQNNNFADINFDDPGFFMPQDQLLQGDFQFNQQSQMPYTYIDDFGQLQTFDPLNSADPFNFDFGIDPNFDFSNINFDDLMRDL